MARSLAAAAQGGPPLHPEQTADVLHATLHPDTRARWRVGNTDFRIAHRCVVHAHLAAERWNSFAILLLGDQGGDAHH